MLPTVARLILGEYKAMMKHLETAEGRLTLEEIQNHFPKKAELKAKGRSSAAEIC
jgi:hypothetical protein